MGGWLKMCSREKIGGVGLDFEKCGVTGSSLTRMCKFIHQSLAIYNLHDDDDGVFC